MMRAQHWFGGSNVGRLHICRFLSKGCFRGRTQRERTRRIVSHTHDKYEMSANVVHKEKTNLWKAFNLLL